ncbi:MAG TPA: hypothetical protein VF070_01425 [Streptosporangiaceae bacterium]
MNDVKQLLSLALDKTPADTVSADPRADLERGRRLLRRRRLLGGAGVTAAIAAGALVPVALQGGGPPGQPGGSPARAANGKVAGTRHSSPAAKPSDAPKGPGSIALVAWTGTQPPGYRVSWMPRGWVVQGSTPFALTIAPPGDKDTNPDSFLGKLVVMLQSADATSPPAGTPQPVNGRPGFFESAAQAGGNTEVLTFRVAGGQWAQVQAPMSLGWNSAELAKFAGGVQVLTTAQPGRG